ncbi:MAG: activase, partial [Desulfobacterales bacterium]|nr:activase [Desulfobacterales bacterium]
SSEAISAALRSIGIKSLAHPPSDEQILKLGRSNTSCKECLPLILTTGTLLNYIKNQKKDDELLVYFMPTGSGPCRFGQYYIFMEDIIKKHEIKNVALFSLSSENGYGELGIEFYRRGWWATVVADVVEDIRSMFLSNAVNPIKAISIIDLEWRKIIETLEKGSFPKLERKLIETGLIFSDVPLKKPASQVPVISLIGEIFVRRDDLSRQYLTEYLAHRGFAVSCGPVSEWIHYADYLINAGISNNKISKMKKFLFMLKNIVMRRDEKRIKSALSKSGITFINEINIDEIIETAKPYISPHLPGEAILTVGSGLKDINSHACGVIAIGPFGCMPNRIAEAILTETMNGRPFIAIETDGSPFPQLTNAKLEAFCLRAERLHKERIKCQL